jgi:hypothetical protein
MSDLLAVVLRAEKRFFALKTRDAYYPKTYAALARRRIKDLEARALELRKLLGDRRHE